MDFTFNEEQHAVHQAVEGIFSGLVTPDRVQQVEAAPDRFDRELWAALAEADLLGLSVPEAYGGGGYGLVELAILLEGQGRVVAPVPLWATVALGAMPLAQFGSEALKSALLPAVVSGDLVLTTALAGVADDIARGGTGRPSVSAKSGADGLVLTGTAVAVPYGHVADRVLIPRVPRRRRAVAVVDPSAPGVTVERATTTNREIHPHLHLDGVTAARTTCWPAATRPGDATSCSGCSTGPGPACARSRWGSPKPR